MRKVEKEASVAMRAGFTLIEILVAVSIIGILSAVAVMNLGGLSESSKITAAKSSVDTIKGAIVTYNLNHPRSLTDLKQLVKEDSSGEAVLDGGEDTLIDPWGQEFKLEHKGTKYVVISAGPDGEFGNSDDIRSDQKVKQQKND